MLEITTALKFDSIENCGHDCIICSRNFDCEVQEKENSFLRNEKNSKIFKVCSSYLKPEVFTNSSNWDSVKISNKISPFCNSCFISGEKLSCMDERLNIIQKDIRVLVEKFSTEIIKHRQEKLITTVLPFSPEIKTEVPTAEPISALIRIKKEIDVDAEFVNETIDDSLPSPKSYLQSSENFVEFNDFRSECNLTENESGYSDQEKITNGCTTRYELKKLSISIERLQYYPGGTQKKIINNKAPTIKLDIPENDSCSDLENCSDESDTDEDSGSDFPSSLPKRKKRKINVDFHLNRNNSLDNTESDFEIPNSEYTCEECKKIFTSKANLKSHIRYKHNISSKIFLCETCGKELRNRKLYTSHIQIHLKSYTCEQCGEKFEGEGTKNKYKYEIHCMAHRNEIPYQCEFCPEEFSNVNRYGDHLKFSSCGKSDMKLLSCKLCDKTFYYKYLLLLHQVDHSTVKRGTGEIDCKLCDKKFRNNKYLLSVLEPHYLCHTEEYLLKCDICLKPVRDKNILNQHRQTHKPDFSEPEFPCENCSKSFTTLAYLKIHLKDVHVESNERFTCEICQKEFRVKKKLTQHVRGHSTNIPCEICNRKFNTVGALNMHMRAHSGEFECKECNVKCPTASGLTTHISVVHRKEKRFICELCGQGYYYSHDYNAHVKRHSEQQSFNCELCGATFSSEYRFKSHMKIHTGKDLDSSECPYICDVCGKLFKYKQSMQQHHNIHHSGITKEYKCEQCDKIFISKSGLRKHIKSSHEEPQNLELPCKVCGGKYRNETALRQHMKQHTIAIPCGICEKTFPTTRHVKIHRLQHTGELFPCIKCDKKFSSSASLKGHNDAVHLKIFRYFCEVCGKGFYKRMGYLGHLETHSNQKTLQCKICGEWFNTRHKLADHKRKMHSGESFECQPCGITFSRKATLNMHNKKQHCDNSTAALPEKMGKRRKITTNKN